jgi:class 3 adenylate cyclase
VDVGEWLRGLGLERYERAFRDNDIDAGMLPGLTARDLQELGVASLGHRKRLLAAVAELPARAERRQLTVTFVDLVGSTTLAARFDPETVRGILRAYQGLVTAEVGGMGGHVAKLMGDGVLAYFGWPRAHEDDAERAVRAGLAIVAAVGRLATPTGEPLAARVGIATGLVVVGELVGEGAAREEEVVGETPNLAARLQEAAGPGTVVLDEGARRLLGELFELASAGPLRLKGFAQPVTAFRVLRERRAGSRFAARSPGRPSPMVGRDRELSLLLERWRQAAAGEGRAVLLVGEAGIGKSRLVRAVQDALADEVHASICWQCSSHHAGTALWPVAQELAQAAGLEPEDDDAARLAKLERLLAPEAEDPARILPPVAALLAIDPGSGYPPIDPDPRRRRAQTLEALLDRLESLAARRPLLLAVEDAHWADPTTLELLGNVLERAAGIRVLVLLTGRYDSLPGHAGVTRLVLDRLGQRESEAIARGLALGRDLPGELVGEIADRAEGVPLFVEELTKAVLEAGEAGTAVPASLQASLLARLDRVPAAKQVAQVAACIGRSFTYALLKAVSSLPEPGLRAALDRLAAAELVFPRGEPPAASYRFKHALLRDAAYESLLRSERRAIHARLLQAIESGAVPAGREQAAYHAACAELWAKALHHYGAAGRAALARAANREGLALIAKALDAGSRLAGDATAEVAMIDLRRARGWAYLATGDVPRIMTELREAEAHAGRYGMTRLTCRLRVLRAHVECIFGGHLRRAIRHGREAARIAEVLHDRELAAAARLVLGLGCLMAGDARAAVAELAVDVDAYHDGLRSAAVGSSGTLAVDGLAVLGEALGRLGRSDEALVRGTEAQAIAAETGNPWDMHVANHHLARTHLARGDAAAALPLVAWNIDFGERHGLRLVPAWHRPLLAQASLLAGDPGKALATAEEALDACEAMHLAWGRVHALLVLAEARLTLRHDGTTPAAEALELARGHGYQAFEAAALRLLAAASLPGDPAGAGRHLAAARSIAEAGAMVPELAAIAALETRAGVQPASAAGSSR